MRKIYFGCLGAAVVTLALQFAPAKVHAGLFSDCTPCEQLACEPCDAVECDPCAPNGCAPVRAGGWFLHGHMEAGFFANAHGAKSTYEYPGYPLVGHANLGRGADGWSGNTDRLLNTRLTGGQVNQVYLSMGKAVDGRRGLDLGGKVDFTWGSDAYLTQARGLEWGAGHGGGTTEGRWGTGDYFASFAQAYAEVAYGKWNVIAGKYAAPFGSSHYDGSHNFFYSWASTATIAPHVGGGAYATYKVNDRLSVTGGWVMPEEIGESSENNAVLGGFDWTPTRNLKIHYAFAAGKNTYAHRAHPLGDKDEYFVQSLTANAQLSKRLEYVFDWTYLQNRGKTAGNIAHSVYTYGINNELIYRLNKKWAFGTRFGMLNNDLCDWYTVGIGANWTPNKWLIVKPEVRYDWTDNPSTCVFNLADDNATLRSTYQLSGGMSAVVKF